MSLADELGQDGARASHSASVASTPHGWRAHVDLDETTGTGTTPAAPVRDAPPSHREILESFGLSPDEWRVLTMRRSRWQAQTSEGLEWLEAYRATFEVIPASDPVIVHVDIDELLAVASRWRPTTPRRPKAGGGPSATMAVPLSDWQLGKGEGGGTAATTARILASLDGAVQRLHTVRRLGYRVDQVALLGLGDIVEQCAGHYAMQTFQADLTMRQQRRLAWRLTLRAVQAFLPHADVLLTGVAGNHGETRKKGKAFTTFDDNDDLLILDAIADISRDDPRYERLTVDIPSDPLSHLVRLSGVGCGLAHGHQFPGGRQGSEKTRQWWADQAFGLHPLKDASILFSGHFHSLDVTEFSEHGRTAIQAPAMDGGSAWFASMTGKSSSAGMLTCLVGEELGPRFWDEIKIV